MIISRFISVAAKGIISFFYDYCSALYSIFCIHSSFDGHLGCFHVLAIANSAAVNPGVHVSFSVRVFILSRYMPRSGLLGHMVTLFFIFFKNLCTVHCELCQFTSPPVVWADPFSPHPLQTSSFSLSIFGIYVYMLRMHYNILVIDFCLPTSCYGENLAVWYNCPFSSSLSQYIITFLLNICGF